MMLAARGAFLAARKKGWTNPYISDSLIAMWDGIVNDGGPVWQDLKGGSEYVAGAGTFSYDQNSTVWNGWSQGPKLRFRNPAVISALNSINFTIEIVVGGTSASDSGNKAPFTIGESNRLFWTWSGGVGLFVCGKNMNGSGFYNYTNKSLVATGTKFYVDGIAKKTYSLSAASYSNTELLYFGTLAALNSLAPNYTFNGHIYGIRIHSRALTAAEIAANYAVDKARFNLP